MLAKKTVGKMNISVASTEFGFRSKTVINAISNDAGKQFDTSKFPRSMIGGILNW